MFNIADVRKKFPALNNTIQGKNPVFLDAPGGSQVPKSVIQAMTDYLNAYNSNLGACYFSSQETTRVMQTAREALAIFMNAASAENISFGATATQIMFNLSRTLSRDWKEGDEIIVTNFDHYSNVSSWVMAAEDKKVTVQHIDINTQTFEIDYEQLEEKINERTKLIAVSYASNVLGSIQDIKRITTLAKKFNVLTMVDSVHYAPHGLIDVQDLGCDFLVVSAYKFFGPHVSALYATTEQQQKLIPYKVEPAPSNPPFSWEQGTQNFEALAGVTQTIEYIASLGNLDEKKSLRQRLEKSFHVINEYEQKLSNHFLAKAEEINLSLYGKKTAKNRTPTFSFRLNDIDLNEFSRFCAEQFTCVAHGNFYAQGICQQFNIVEADGLLRVGFLSYNTLEEIDFFFELLADFLNTKGVCLK